MCVRVGCLFANQQRDGSAGKRREREGGKAIERERERRGGVGSLRLSVLILLQNISKTLIVFPSLRRFFVILCVCVKVMFSGGCVSC